MTSIITTNDDWNKTTNNGYLRSPTNNKKINCVMDEVTGPLLDDRTTTLTTSDTIGVETQSGVGGGGSSLGQTSTSNGPPKTTIVHFGPGPITKTSIQKKSIYNQTNVRNRIIILAILFTILGAILGALTINFAQSVCSTGISISLY